MGSVKIKAIAFRKYMSLEIMASGKANFRQ
jgi:hypothetical protein